MSEEVKFTLSRVEEVLEYLQRIAGGETTCVIPLSEQRDHLDAISFGVSAIAQELVYLKEAADAANEAKTRFLAMMSHEIRTPLTAILGLSQLIDDPALAPAERSDRVRRIRSNGRMLLSLVDSVLDLAAIEAGKTQIVPQLFSPAEALKDVIQCLDHEAAKKKLELTYEIASDVPALMTADPNRVRQMLTNLVSNAIKFTHSGRVAVSMTCAAGRDGSAELAISVTDSGIGIEPAKQPLLFHPFRKAHGREIAGTGLGLVISRGLAKLMNGDLTLVRSSPGEGSTFVITLPVGESEAPCGSEADAKNELGERRLAGLRVLIADDNEDLLFLFALVLENEGATVTSVADGEAALAITQTQTFDVVLMDVNMPRLNGVEATRRLRARGFMAPIIALTAHALGTIDAQSQAAGYTGTLVKPFKEEALIALLRSLQAASTH